MNKYQAETCGACGQTTSYAMALDRGTALMVLAIANAVKRLGRNRIHVSKEMLAMAEPGEAFLKMIGEGYMTPTMEHNLAKPRYHGLIAFVDRGSGEYLLTRKGADFIKGARIKRIAIIDKTKGKNGGYWEEAGDVSIVELLRDKKRPTWEYNLTELSQALDGPEITKTLL